MARHSTQVSLLVRSGQEVIELCNEQALSSNPSVIRQTRFFAILTKFDQNITNFLPIETFRLVFGSFLGKSEASKKFVLHFQVEFSLLKTQFLVTYLMRFFIFSELYDKTDRQQTKCWLRSEKNLISFAAKENGTIHKIFASFVGVCHDQSRNSNSQRLKAPESSGKENKLISISNIKS